MLHHKDISHVRLTVLIGVAAKHDLQRAGIGAGATETERFRLSAIPA